MTTTATGHLRPNLWILPRSSQLRGGKSSALVGVVHCYRKRPACGRMPGKRIASFYTKSLICHYRPKPTSGTLAVAKIQTLDSYLLIPFKQSQTHPQAKPFQQM
jgi:hypothetical protein